MNKYKHSWDKSKCIICGCEMVVISEKKENIWISKTIYIKNGVRFQTNPECLLITYQTKLLPDKSSGVLLSDDQIESVKRYIFRISDEGRAFDVVDKPEPEWIEIIYKKLYDRPRKRIFR